MGSAILAYNRRLSLDAQRIRYTEAEQKNQLPSNANPNYIHPRSLSVRTRTCSENHPSSSAAAAISDRRVSLKPDDSDSDDDSEEDERIRQRQQAMQASRKGSRRFSIEIFLSNLIKPKKKSSKDKDKDKTSSRSNSIITTESKDKQQGHRDHSPHQHGQQVELKPVPSTGGTKAGSSSGSGSNDGRKGRKQSGDQSSEMVTMYLM